jgi:hypothetical protein
MIQYTLAQEPPAVGAQITGTTLSKPVYWARKNVAVHVLDKQISDPRKKLEFLLKTFEKNEERGHIF